jgi:hypothetical protein
MEKAVASSPVTGMTGFSFKFLKIERSDDPNYGQVYSNTVGDAARRSGGGYSLP